MTTASVEQQALVAAAPILIGAIQQIRAFVATTLTGDPTQIPLRADAAANILIGNLKLQLPALFSAEVGVVHSEIDGGLAALEAKLQGLVSTTTPAATAPATAA